MSPHTTTQIAINIGRTSYIVQFTEPYVSTRSTRDVLADVPIFWSYRITAILVSRFMLDLQRVKQQVEGSPSLGSLQSLSFDRVGGMLGSISSTLQPEDVWGGGREGGTGGHDVQESQDVQRQDIDRGISAATLSQALSPHIIVEENTVNVLE